MVREEIINKCIIISYVKSKDFLGKNILKNQKLNKVSDIIDNEKIFVLINKLNLILIGKIEKIKVVNESILIND